jgi:CheY-like chemotaxis protein
MALILIADDDDRGREAYAMILRLCGYEVVTAAEGEAALRVLRERPVDLVLLDLAMPETCGQKVLRAMKANPTLRDTPVLVISALPEPVAAARISEMGAAGLMIKSRFSKRDLVGRIEHLLARPAVA